MNWFTGILVFLVTWWIVLFMVLPWGVKRDENPEIGHEVGAPQRPMMWRKAGITTVIAAIIFAFIFVSVDQGLISFRPGSQ